MFLPPPRNCWIRYWFGSVQTWSTRRRKREKIKNTKQHKNFSLSLPILLGVNGLLKKIDEKIKKIIYLYDDFAVSQPQCGGQFQVSAENPPVPLTWDYNNNQDCFWTFNLAPASEKVKTNHGKKNFF